MIKDDKKSSTAIGVDDRILHNPGNEPEPVVQPAKQQTVDNNDGSPPLPPVPAPNAGTK